MNDLISRQAAIEKSEMLFKELKKDTVDMMGIGYNHAVADNIGILKNLPSAPERKRGKWTEKEVIHAEEAETIITEWQSCKCSVCGRYDTRPYLYYFDEPRFCSWCGADMRQDDPSHPFADDVMMKGEADAETD